MALRDVTTSGSIGGGRVPLDFVSLGGMTVFSEEVWNLRFTMRSAVDQIVTPQIHDAWLTDYTLNRAAGTLEQHVGISPGNAPQASTDSPWTPQARPSNSNSTCPESR